MATCWLKHVAVQCEYMFGACAYIVCTVHIVTVQGSLIIHGNELLGSIKCGCFLH